MDKVRLEPQPHAVLPSLGAAQKARYDGSLWVVGTLTLMIVVPVLVVMWVLWQGGMLGGESSKRLLSPGMAAPDFALPAQDGRTFRLANYTGRAVFVAFVPSWTDPKTIAEVRSLAATQSQFDAAGAKVLVVSGDDAAKAKALHTRERLPFPLLMDVDNTLAKQYSVPQGDFRTTFVVDPAGQVKFRVTDAAVEADKHGTQLLNVSRCCIDEVMAARSHGVGGAVGDFSLRRADTGAMETLIGDGKQQATVALFLSVKCPCSNSYNERIAALEKTFAGKPVRLIGVYSNQDETSAEIAQHARQNGFTFPVFQDERALGADHLGASVTPEVFVLDDKRVLRYAGRIDDNRDAAQAKTHELQDAIEDTLSGKPLKKRDTHAFGCGIVKK